MKAVADGGTGCIDCDERTDGSLAEIDYDGPMQRDSVGLVGGNRQVFINATHFV